MSKKSEQKIDNVFVYEDMELKNLQKQYAEIDESGIDLCIAQSEALLRSLGYELPSVNEVTALSDRKVLVVPSFDELSAKAQISVGNNSIEDLFTEEELKENAAAIKKLNHDYNMIHHLDKYDVIISAAAAILGAVVDIVLVGIPQKGPAGLEAGKLADYVRKKFDEKFSPEEMGKLANSKESKVPFDAQDNRKTKTYVDGLSAYYHRMLSLGHDPILGFVFGLYDIMHGTMTTIDKSGHIVCQVMEVYSERKETEIVSALLKQIIHFKSDITTSMGLPAPLMGLFNLCQFGSIGEEEQTVAEIVQGMYYEGFDFIHFCAQSIPTILIELVTRIGYAVKRIKEGNKVKDSIPISLNREKHPKLATMLFIAHTGATAVNAGKVYFTKNPMAINYPQWIAFAKYSYKQLKWVLVAKPVARLKYVQGILDEELNMVLYEDELLFNEYTRNYLVVFE
ncbi:MAG: hypothetical protein HXL50_05980 [Solobacterium sp.]|nr:hypothetical protein [Solobacterium sp.]